MIYYFTVNGKEGKSAEMKTKNGKEIVTKTGRKIRSKHSGRLELRGKVYLARWMVNGKRFSASTGETDREAAEAWLERQLASVKATDVKTRSIKKRQTLKEQHKTLLTGAEAQALDDRDKELAALPSVAVAEIDELYQNIVYGHAYDAATWRACKDNTSNQYHTSARKFIDWLAGKHPEVKDLKQVTVEIARQYGDELKSKFVGSTARIRIFQLQKIWDVLADRYESIEENPWKRVKKPSESKSARRELTREELAKVAAVLKGEMLICFFIGCFTGLRLSDASTLKWESIDLTPEDDPTHPNIHLMPKKTSNREKWIDIPVVPELYAVLSKIPRSRRHGFVTPELAEKYERDHSHLSGAYVDAFKAAGLDTTTADGRNICGFHALRHSFVSIAANAGIPFMVVQSIVGHSTAKMSAHYFHENRRMVSRAFDRFPTLFNTAQETPKIGYSDAIDAEVIDIPSAATDAAEGRFSRLRAILAEMRDAGDDMGAAVRLAQEIGGAEG